MEQEGDGRGGERKKERETNHSRLLGGYWMYRVVAVVELFSSGLSFRINILSAVIRESRLGWKDSIWKSVLV